jgi:hypothetical protein
VTAAAEGVAAAPDVLDYRLDAGDALAWERVSPAYRKRDRLALAASLFAGLGLLKMLSGQLEDVPGLHSLPAAFILMALPVLMVGLFQYRDRRQRAKARAGGEMRLEVWPDRMIEHRADRRAPLVLGGRSLRALRETRDHVFLTFGREDVVIVPTRAFVTPAAKAHFATHWRGKIG